MNLDDVRRLLGARCLGCSDLLDRPVEEIAATDLMSEVLAYSLPGTLLLTELCNVQVINTAEVAGLTGVVFVGGSHPAAEVIDRANSLAIPTLAAPLAMSAAREILDRAGLPVHEHLALGPGTFERPESR